MKIVLTLACLLAVAHHVTAQCGYNLTFTETFVPQCAPNDVYVRWPNYEDPTTYYSCNGVNNPVEMPCPASQYFTFVLQQCVPCGQYIPPVQCSQLKTQNRPNCVPINGGVTSSPTGSPGGSTYPTPNYPATNATTGTTRTTTTRTTTAGTTRTTTTRTTTTPAAVEPPTPPTAGPSTGTTTTAFPEPPSPVTNDPNLPMPPTPEPTPPSVPVAPPSIPAPPTSG